MNIVIFSERDIRHPFGGGSPLNIHEQAKRWVAQGHRVTMITTRPWGTPFKTNIDGMDVYHAGNRFMVYLCAPLLYLLLRDRADVVFDIINGIPFFTPLFCRRPKAALMHHVHRDMFLIELGPVLGRIGLFIESYLVPVLYRNVPIVTVSGSTMGNMKRMLFRGDRLDIRLVYNGIDHDFYRPDGPKYEQPTVLYLGRVKRYKRIPRLISMMPEVRRRVPDARLIIAGGGDAETDLEEAIEEAGAGGYVTYLGFVSEEEKLELYRRAWVQATPSLVEGWGLTVIEANACGTPAVAFHAPGLSESIVHGKSGLLASDDAEFVDNLVQVLQDPELRHALERGAIERAGEFNWNETASQVLDILEEVLERRAGA